MGKTKSVKKEIITYPRNLDEANLLIYELRQDQRQISLIEKETEGKIEIIKKESVNAVTPFRNDINEKLNILNKFFDEHKDELTESGKKKSCALPAGAMGKRWGKTTVEFKKEKNELLQEIKKMGDDYQIFIRTVEEINKQEMLKDREKAQKIDGVEFSQKEYFFVKGEDLNLEIPILSN